MVRSLYAKSMTVPQSKYKHLFFQSLYFDMMINGITMPLIYRSLPFLFFYFSISLSVFKLTLLFSILLKTTSTSNNLKFRVSLESVKKKISVSLHAVSREIQIFSLRRAQRAPC